MRFLAAGVCTVLGLAASACGGHRPTAKSPSVLERGEPAGSRPRRAVLFRAVGFPTVDAPVIDEHSLDAALADLPVDRAAGTSDLSEHLRSADVLVLPYGSAFPVDAWTSIQAFVGRGGSLAVLGGAPFHEPVRREGDAWVRGPRQTAFAHDLRLGPAEPIAMDGAWTTVDRGELRFGARPSTTWALTVRLTETKDFPDEHGSAGPREGVVRPLVHVVDGSGTARGCPLLEIERRSGSRHILATSNAPLEASLIRAIVRRALDRPRAPSVRIERASVPPGAEVHVRVEAATDIRVFDEADNEILRKELPTGDVAFSAPRAPGLYRVRASSCAGTATTGFWVKDEALLARGPRLGVGRDWLTRDGRPFPIVGTTYMASDVHRHFLFEPNPHVWDRDFADMQRRGITFVRTGLWSAWSRVATNGVVDAGVLSALEAFVLGAARHGIVVCFNLFAFLPPSFGGDNPYLDPRAVAGQQAFASAFAAHFRDVGWIHWDLINEPSYAPLPKIWKTRAIGDPHERAAFRAWAEARHGTSEGKLRSLWHEPGDLWAPPTDEDFEQTAMQVQKRPRKTRDFREMIETSVAAWASSMREAIRAAGGSTLVTLGQDEGGIFERPTQAFLAKSLDYTAVHTWWKNDDLLWDGVVTKDLAKPNLHQETGLMRLEDLDGTPWRTPEAAARLLERKLGYAFAARGAGVVEWVWNVNPYMPIDEESTIGLFRPDGTAKPELDVLERFARFFARADGIGDFEPDPVVMVLPHARAFLGMTGALDATKEVVRALGERFGIVPAAVSDLLLDRTSLANAKLVLVPAPDVLDERAAKVLLDASRAGTKVLVTGAVTGDSYGLKAPSLEALGLLGASRPVAVRERGASFEGLLQESARRAESTLSFAGNVWHEPLPLERARDREPLVKLLASALARAKVATSPDDGGVVGRVLTTPTRALLVVINEKAEPATRRLRVDGRAIDVRVGPGGSAMLLLDRRTGKTLIAL